MGLIGRIFGGESITSIGRTVTGVAEVFRPNATQQMQLGHQAYMAALDQHGEEFAYGGLTWFDRLMNGLNRLPRPMLALGTLGLVRVLDGRSRGLFRANGRVGICAGSLVVAAGRHRELLFWRARAALRPSQEDGARKPTATHQGAPR